MFFLSIHIHFVKNLGKNKNHPKCSTDNYINILVDYFFSMVSVDIYFIKLQSHCINSSKAFLKII